MKLKLLLFLFLILLLPQQAFAVIATFQTTGKVIDSDNHVISGGKIVFRDDKGTIVASGFSNQSGVYSILVPEGTYDVVVDPPVGVNAPKITTNGLIISGDTSHDFTLATPPSKNTAQEENSQTKGPNLMVVTGLVISLFIVGGFIFYFFWSRKKKILSDEKVPADNSDN